MQCMQPEHAAAFTAQVKGLAHMVLIWWLRSSCVPLLLRCFL